MKTSNSINYPMDQLKQEGKLFIPFYSETQADTYIKKLPKPKEGVLVVTKFKNSKNKFTGIQLTLLKDDEI